MITTHPMLHGKLVKEDSHKPTYTEPHENWGSYRTGKAFRNDYYPIQKGDKIHALPWKWTETKISPFGDTLTQWTHKLTYPDYPGWSQKTNTLYKDIRNLTIPPVSSLSLLKSLTADQRELVNSTAILKAQASVNKSVMALPLIWRERKMTLSTAKSYSRFILNNMITMQRKDVKKWLKALKRKTTPNKLKQLANDIANRHLEFVFGVLPLIEEIGSLVDHLQEPYTSVRTGRGRMRLVIESDGPTSNQTYVSNEHTIRSQDKYYHDYSVRVNLRYEIVNELLNNSSLMGFNPFYYWYDNTPLSFVVGWFSNFNTWVMTLDSNEGLNYVTGSMSQKDERRIERTCSANDYVMAKQFNLVKSSTLITELGTSSVSEVVFDRLVFSKPPPIQRLRFMDKTSFFTHAASVSLMIQRYVKEYNELSAQKTFKYRGPKVRNLPPIKYRKVTL